ncbi:MAG: D-2-hydroxyacid dehydrogenase [Saprospiraceae bacterium]|nr:D-2-hydroxyacid dehydrogenase [Saprospiraceae bacterium]
MELSTSKPRIVILDGFTLNPGDLQWDALEALGWVARFDFTSEQEVVTRASHADILIVNKTAIDAAIMAQLPDLRCICVTATGYNNIDVEMARQRGITVCNVSGYSSDAVAQHVFALILALSNRVYEHHLSVQQGDWSRCRDFSYSLSPIHELAGKTLGIYGFGRIGQAVARIGQAFGMQLLVTHRRPLENEAIQVSITELFSRGDYITLHAPLTAENQGLVNWELLQQMKPSAVLINTSRGALIVEADLRRALQQRSLAAAALDVLSQEPPPADHPLLGLPNCLITPHNAWASVEARRRLMDITVKNVAAFLAGSPQNVVGCGL